MIDNPFQRSHQLPCGDVITLAAGTGEDGMPCVTATRACTGPNVTAVTLTFPMKTAPAARHFVAQADEDVFSRAKAKLDAELQLVALIEEGLAGKRLGRRTR